MRMDSSTSSPFIWVRFRWYLPEVCTVLPHRACAWFPPCQAPLRKVLPSAELRSPTAWTGSKSGYPGWPVAHCPCLETHWWLGSSGRTACQTWCLSTACSIAGWAALPDGQFLSGSLLFVWQGAISPSALSFWNWSRSCQCGLLLSENSWLGPFSGSPSHWNAPALIWTAGWTFFPHFLHFSFENVLVCVF